MSASTGNDSEPNRRLELSDLSTLSPHERIIPERLEELISNLRDEGVVHLPILVDDETGVILDGHHRFYALRELGARTVPTLRINYLEDPGIDLAPGPNCPVESLTRAFVLKTGQSDSPFPPKSTRHRVTFDYPVVDRRLDELRDAPS